MHGRLCLPLTVIGNFTNQAVKTCTPPPHNLLIYKIYGTIIQYFRKTVPLKSLAIVESENFFLRIPRRIRGVPMENARKVSNRIRRKRGKYLSVYGENCKLGLFAVHKIISEYAESI